MDAKQYIGFFYGNKKEALIQLDKSIALYENSPLHHTPKVKERILKYKSLREEIQKLIDNERAQN